MTLTTQYVHVLILVLAFAPASLTLAQVGTTNPAQTATRTAPVTFGRGVRAADSHTPTPQFAAIASGLYARTIVDTQSVKGDYKIRIWSLSVSPKVTTGETTLPGAAMLSLTAGTVEYVAGDQRGKLKPGDTASIPEGASLRFVNSGGSRAAVLRAVIVSSSKGSQQKTPHVVRNPSDFKEDRKFISPPTLGQPIYACSSAITVQNFLPGAKIEVFINGAPAPNPSFIGTIPSPGQTHDTGVKFTAGQVVYVTQTLGTATSAHSNHVTVTSHTED